MFVNAEINCKTIRHDHYYKKYDVPMSSDKPLKRRVTSAGTRSLNSFISDILYTETILERSLNIAPKHLS